MFNVVVKDEDISFSCRDNKFYIIHNIEGIIIESVIHDTYDNFISMKKGLIGLIKNISEDMPLIFTTNNAIIDLHDSDDLKIQEFLQAIKEFLSQ